MNLSATPENCKVQSHGVGANTIRVCPLDDLVASFGGGSQYPLRVLLLADDKHPSPCVIDHIDAICRHSRHRVTVINPIHERFIWLISCHHCDVLIVHYSICILSNAYISESVSRAVRYYTGPKIQIIQDEYRWVNRMAYQMSHLGIEAVFSSLSPDNASKVYHHEFIRHVCIVPSLPGYVSQNLLSLTSPPLSKREFDIVYRGRSLASWYGKYTQEKMKIGLHATDLSQRHGLRSNCKFGEEDRIYGTQWIKFLMSGRATVATEGGATVFDFDESIEKAYEKYQEQHPGATADELWQEIVRPHEGNVTHRTLTPRIIEAIMCRTALILYPGEYRRILQPWEHYIPLEKDGSNDAQVAALVKDDVQLSAMIERAYRRVVDDPTLQFAHYVAAIDAVIDDLVARPRPEQAGSPFQNARLQSFVLTRAAAWWLQYRWGKLSIGHLKRRFLYRPKWYLKLRKAVYPKPILK